MVKKEKKKKEENKAAGHNANCGSWTTEERDRWHG